MIDYLASLHLTAFTWFLIGIALFFLELLTPVFVECFFGLGALSVALVCWICPATPLWLQLALFTASTILYILTLRRYLRSVFAGRTSTAARIDNEYVGRLGVVVSPIAPDLPGRIRVGDAEWSAASSASIPAGADVRIVAQTNLTFTVEPVRKP